MKDLNLKDLLQDSRQLTSHIIPSSLAPVERGLDQIEASTKRLLQRTTAPGTPGQALAGADSRTAYLLASRGIDSDRVLQNLIDVNLNLSFEALQGIADTDIESFLRNEHETLISIVIEETKKRSTEEFEGVLEGFIQEAWEAEKRRILENMGQRMGKAMEEDLPAASKLNLKDHPRLKAYLQVVKTANSNRLNNSPYNILGSLQRAAEKTSTDQLNGVTECWGLLTRMLGLEGESAGKKLADTFSQVYKEFKENKETEGAILFRSKMVKGGRGWLQDNYRKWLQSYVREQQAELGGMPTVHTEVDAYLKLKFYRNKRWTVPWLEQSIGSVPFWGHVYLLTRMGLMKDALAYIQKYSKELQASKDLNFETYYRAWMQSPDGRLPKTLRDGLMGEWNGRLRDIVVNNKTAPKGDAFKYALYKIIGRCELSIKTVRNTDVVATTEDYLWVQTMLVSLDSSDVAFEKYTLQDFSAAMQTFGKAYFQKTDIWFMVLLLAGEFEKSINELVIDPLYALDGLHFSIGMAYHGVLLVPLNPTDIPKSNSLLSTRGEFHFSRIMTQLVHEWVKNEFDILHYIYLIGLYPAYNKHNYSFICQLLIQLDLPSQLIGAGRDDGRGRTLGLIEVNRALINLKSEQDYLDTILLKIGEECDKGGRSKDALELYNLCGHYDKAIGLLIRKIAHSILSNDIDTEEDENSLTAARVLDYYMTRPQESASLDPKVVVTCRSLITLSQFVNLANNGNFENALTLFYTLDMVPEKNDPNLVQKKAAGFTANDEAICKVIPSILVKVTSCLSSLYNHVLQSRAIDRQNRLLQIKDKTTAILNFASLIQYHIPAEVFAKMNRTAVMMG